MRNNYLYITEHTINFSDGVFSGIANRENNLFEKEANGFRHSKLINYNRLTKEQREEIAKRWEKAKSLPDGRYDYYFNLEDKNKIFEKSVKELANTLGISYKLTVK